VRTTKPRGVFGPENRLRELGWSLEDEKLWYAELLERIRRRPRFYLDNLSEFEVFRVSFINYRPYRSFDEGTIRVFNE